MIISGPPAAGKTTCARPLADALGYVLLCMDTAKERMADAIGDDALNIADDLSDQAVRKVISSARKLLAYGNNVIVEGFFQSDRYSEDLSALAALANSVLLHIQADDAELRKRFEQRALQDARHWIHADRAKLPYLQPELPEYMAKRLQLPIPHLIVDTTRSEVDIDATASLIMAALSHRTTEHLV